LGNNIILAKTGTFVCILCRFAKSFSRFFPDIFQTNYGKITLLPKDNPGKIIGKKTKKISTCYFLYTKLKVTFKYEVSDRLILALPKSR
jgi:hypothetical protein